MIAQLCLSAGDRVEVRVNPGHTAPFIVMTVGDLSVFLPGYGDDSALSARILSAKLAQAADALDAMTATKVCA